MRFSPEQLAGLPESTDRRGRARRNPSALTSIEIGESNGGIVLNVSENGVAIAVAQSMAIGRLDSLSFRLPQLDRTFRAGGEIVWLSESKKTAGVRFVNLEERDRVQIRDWIRAEIVAAELQTPPRESAGPAAPKPVLIMPSPRQAVRQAETEAERDEARAAEFDRMFPSEASLNVAQTPAELEVNAEPEFNLLAATTEEEDVELAVEAFLATREENDAEADVGEVEAGPVEILALEPQVIATAERESEVSLAETTAPEEQVDEAAGREAEIRWREEWERQYQLERENLERTRSLEMIPELPAPFALGVADAPGATTVASEVGATEPFMVDLDDAGISIPPTAEPAVEEVVLAQARYAPAEAPLRAGGLYQAAAARTKNHNSPLSIAALCTVLVAMCFILGYAIQPGAFRFRAPKSADTPGDASTRNGTSPSAQESAATSAAPVSVDSPQVVPSTENGASNAAEGNKDSGVLAENEKSNIVSGKNADTAAAEKITTERTTAPAAVSPAPALPAVTPSTKVAANSANANSQPAPTTTQPAASSGTSPVGGSPSAAGAAPIATPTAAPGAAIPVSFFPVTAPSAGSPAKLMQLPEETISETSSVVVRSHQFLFVPAQAGPESEHPLERVHLGDRIVKVSPTYPAQAWEKFQGGTVHLRSTIGPDGAVLDVQAISGPTSLIPAAANAVRQWRYNPTDIDGRPIAIEEDILVEFRPSRETATK
jgi:TonB family protein